MIRNRTLLVSTDSELYNEMPQDNCDMQSANCGIVCYRGHTYDESSKAVCPVCAANPLNVIISSPQKNSAIPSQQVEFDVNVPFYKEIIPRAHHLLDAEIGLDMDATYYNGAPLSQTYRTKNRARNSGILCCIL